MPKRQIGVIGLGNFGAAVARTLARRGTQVLCVDRDMDKVQAIKDDVTHAVQADATDEQALRAVGMAEADTVVISLGQDIAMSLLAAMVIQELGVPHLVAKAVIRFTHGFCRSWASSGSCFLSRTWGGAWPTSCWPRE